MRKYKELPSEYQLIEYKRVINHSDYLILNNGLAAINMEDKWSISKKNNTIYFHRSWTKNCIYEFDIVEKDNVKFIEQVKVNNNPKQYKFSNNLEEIEMFNDILELFLNKKLSGSYK